MLWCRPGVSHPTQLLQSMEQFVFKLSALVVMQSCWITKPRDEVIEYSFRCRFSRLVFSCIGLGKSREVINYDKNVLITPFAGFKVQEVNGN